MYNTPPWGMGWRNSRPDHRDYRLTLPFHILDALPPRVDLRPNMPPIEDQGQLGSCTSFAIAGAVRAELLKQGEPDVAVSHLFVYYNERDVEGTVASDAGAELRTGLKVVGTLGVCPEAEWPYDIGQFA